MSASRCPARLSIDFAKSSAGANSPASINACAESVSSAAASARVLRLTSDNPSRTRIVCRVLWATRVPLYPRRLHSMRRLPMKSSVPTAAPLSVAQLLPKCQVFSVLPRQPRKTSNGSVRQDGGEPFDGFRHLADWVGLNYD